MNKKTYFQAGWIHLLNEEERAFEVFAGHFQTRQDALDYGRTQSVSFVWEGLNGEVEVHGPTFKERLKPDQVFVSLIQKGTEGSSISSATPLSIQGLIELLEGSSGWRFVAYQGREVEHETQHYP